MHPASCECRTCCISRAGQVIAEGLARQQARPPREAARLALGRHATEQQINDWIAVHRPQHARTA